MNAIELSNFKFSYGTTPILDISRLVVKESEFVFLFGALSKLIFFQTMVYRDTVSQ